MSMPNPDLIGCDLHDSDNQLIGKVTAIYQYPADVHAWWGAAAVTHGLIRRSTNLVDLELADFDGATVQVPHTRHTITTAPNYAPQVGDTLTDDQAADVRAHYWGAAQPA